MANQDAVLRLYMYCAQHKLLRPIYWLLRFVQPLITTNNRISNLVAKIRRDPGQPSKNPTESFWQIPPHPDLSNKQSVILPERADVIIIGSGMTAASIAHHLLSNDSGITITILEARNLCSGATGRNGGHIQEIPYDDYDTACSLLGKEAAMQLIRFRLSHLGAMIEYAKKEMSEEAAKYSEIRVVETVDAAFDEQQWLRTKKSFQSLIQDFPELKQTWKLYEGEEARKKFELPDIFGAITGPAGAVWPYRFVTNVFENLIAKYPKRLSIETNTPALEITTSDGSIYPYLIATPRGTISARHIVHATNGHVGHLVPRMRGKIFPLRGQMTVQASERCKSNLGADRSWLLSHGKGFDYMTRNVHTDDFFLGGGVLQGGNGGLDDVGNPADDTENFLSICHLSGVLSRVTRSPKAPGEDSGPCSDEEPPRLKASWSGVIALSCDMMPWVGKLPIGISGRELKSKESLSSGEWIAAGYTGSGMVYCWRSGEAIATMIRGEELGDWFPRCLLPTMKRFDSVGPEEIAAHFHAMAT